ncbi:MAG: hypothetical protein IJ557_01820 [Bacteroidaceae bacterium]|nr:hypothetical protein [Bacteroidaceae bacterium]
MLKSIEKVINTLNEKGIIYCHWKSNEHLKEALEGDTDLDVLFLPEQRLQVEMALDACGMKRFRSTPLMQYNAIEDFIGFDKETAKIWHLHTHYRMTLGEKHLKGYTVNPWGRLILDNRRKDELGIYCSAVEDELIMLLIRMAMKLRLRDQGRKISKDDRREMVWLLEHSDQALISVRAKQFVGEHAVDEIVHLVNGKKLMKKNQLKKLRKELIIELKLYTEYSVIGSRWMRHKREWFWLVGGVRRRLGLNSSVPNRRISPNGGNVITFLGCDGAGKSTTLAYVKKELNKKLDVVSIYFGSGDGSSSLIRKPMKLVAKKVGGKGLGHSVENEYSEKKRISLKSRLYSIAKILWAVTLAKEKESKIKYQTKARNNGLIVLTDRYPQTLFAGCSDGPLLSRYKEVGIMNIIATWEKKIYASAAMNPPDLTIKLIVPTDVAIARKPEMTKEEIELKKEIIMNLSLSNNTLIVDTSRPFEETRSEILEAIWNIL